MTTFYLIRHGEADYSRQDTLIFDWKGIHFSPLTKKGRKQVLLSASDPRLTDCSIIISSPYTRALESASILSKKLNLELIVEPTIFEWMGDKYARHYEESGEETRIEEYNRLNGVYPKGENREWEKIR